MLRTQIKELRTKQDLRHSITDPPGPTLFSLKLTFHRRPPQIQKTQLNLILLFLSGTPLASEIPPHKQLVLQLTALFAY